MFIIFMWSMAKMKNSIPQRRNSVERSKLYTTNKHIHECSLFWLGTGTSIKMAG